MGKRAGESHAPTRYVSNRSFRRTRECFLSSLLCKALIMQTKGKGSKVLVAICKDRSRLLTFPRGDSPPLKAVYVTSPVREKVFDERICTVVQWGVFCMSGCNVCSVGSVCTICRQVVVQAVRQQDVGKPLLIGGGILRSLFTKVGDIDCMI